jgi:hypothetical protein
MNKRIVLISLLLVSSLLLSSCDKIGINHRKEGGLLVIGEGRKADIRTEQIVSAIKDKDREALKSLFSKKALDEANDLDNRIDYLFDLIQGDIDSWEKDGQNNWSSSESIEYGKRSLMIRFSFDVKTDKDVYLFYVIDYNTDTINPDNQGVYMLELIKFTDEEDLESWPDRMRAGIYIH